MWNFRNILVASSLLVGLAWPAGPSAAQTSTTGAVHGRVTDAASGSPLIGVTVVATSPVLQGSSAEITDSGGRFRLTNLPPGTYLVTFYYGTAQLQRSGVEVPLGQVTVLNQKFDVSAAEGEVIEIQSTGSTIDPTSTNQGTSITQEQMLNIPMPGRTFTSALGQAAGSQGDFAGVSFSGSTSLENQYVIDGVNTTSLRYGTVGSPLINDFIEEIQVITGGYQAEYGRATGAVVNVVTKQGTNELHGTAFVTAIPYQVNRRPVRDIATSIDGTTDLDYRADLGFDLGGPFIKDKLWFYVGFAPQISQNNITRTVQRRTDCREVTPEGTLTRCDPGQYMDGVPDEDPTTGDLIHEKVDETQWKTNAQVYQWVSKINAAVSPEHQGQVALVGTPVAGQGIFGVSGSSRAIRADFQALTTDVSGKWTSKFNDNKTEVELVTGWHRDKYDQDALDDSVLDTPTTRVYLSTLHRFGAAGQESPAVLAGCRDSAAGDDPYPLIDNCPVFQYWLDSPGFTIDDKEDRRSGLLKLTQRIDAAGDHIVKAGVDVEDNRTRSADHFTGGRYFMLIPDPAYNQVRVYRQAKAGPDGSDVCGFDTDSGGNPDFDVPRQCDFVDTSWVTGQTLNWSGFVQDSWQIRPNLTLNAGVRYEEQRLRNAKEIHDEIDPMTMEPYGKNGLVLKGMLAPRVGLLYDWTKEGRSKVYSSYGRFYESVPMMLNNWSFNGEALYGAFYNFAQCAEGSAPSQDSMGLAPSPYNCPQTVSEETYPGAGDVYFATVSDVAPGTKAQYMDEIILGSDYELLEDLRVGAALKHRWIGRVLEDMSIDDGDSYIIGNPGYFDEGEEDKLLDEIGRLPEGSPERTAAEARLEGLRAMRDFDRPVRKYSALELTMTKRVSRNFYVQGSYTYARTVGNYPGLYDQSSGAILPNISTQYDFAELLANRYGPLPQDRPHYLKLDGYYVFDLKEVGQITTGLRVRAFSGTPVDALGGNYQYGLGESYLLPRGSQGRTEFVSNTDLHVSYGRTLTKGYEITAFVDIINAFNQEQTFLYDELYSYDNANPIVGGDEHDLVFAKSQSATGTEMTTPIRRNVGYKQPIVRYSPLFVRVGARLSF